MELKKTLLMPKTDFEMRGNLAQKEPKLIEDWEKEDLYHELLKNREGCKEYAFHDGPPYANGDIHCGHMLNRILKDFIVREKTMEGFKVPFIFGFDTHGLPIENQVIKAGVNRKTTPPEEFREKCREYALKQVAHQSEQIKRLGVVGDLHNPYLTLSREFEAHQIEVFAKMALRGLIYKGLKPVYWSWSSESALAEAEIEYKDVKSFSIYVAFDVIDGKDVVPNDAKVIIWTTTPWTLPSNLSISANPKFVYGLYNTNRGKLLFLKEFEERLREELGLTTCELIKEIRGQELEFVKTKHPFYDRESPIILGEHVTNETGTGLVHTAPGLGADDYVVCQKYGIAVYCPVDDHGKLTAEVGEELAGLFYEDANLKVLEILTKNEHLLKQEEIVHAYPHDWRTGKPLIFRATPQWFCSISKIKDELLREVDKVNWVPAWGKDRMTNMIKDRVDWCISRQRIWGVPIPIIYAEDGTPIIEQAIFDNIVKIFLEEGSDSWFKNDAYYFLPEGYKNEHSPNGKFTKEKDIMDVWFDSGSSFNAVMVEGGHSFPVDLYLEGSDQYRGWFNSSLIVSVACYDKAPYKNVVSHGWVLDEKSEKMSKSKGNGIDPIKVANVYGADILRLWVATVDYQQDVPLSDKLIAQVADQYRKIRNTFKFLLGNLSNGEESKFDPVKDKVDHFEAVDNFVLANLENVKNSVLDAYNHYEFANVISRIMTFLSTDLSSFYLDIGKDILYCNGKDSLRRKMMQNVIFEVADVTMRLLAPILPFTMEEVYKNMPNYDGRNVALLDMPKHTEKFDSSVLKDYKDFLNLRNDVNKAIEEKRANNVVGSAQEVELILPNNELLKKYHLDENLDELARLFIVSKVSLGDKLEANRTSGEKCPRCWNYVDHLEEVDEETHVCHRCHETLLGK